MDVAQALRPTMVSQHVAASREVTLLKVVKENTELIHQMALQLISPPLETDPSMRLGTRINTFA